MTVTNQPLLLGIEIGGTKLQLGLGRGDGEIVALERRTIEPAQGARGILAQIGELVPILQSRIGATRDQVAAVGIGFGGPVDANTGVTTKSHQVTGWDQFPLAKWVRANLQIPLVSIQNDADTAGLAEARFGAGVGFSPLLYVTIGSGIGGGLLLDGQIYRGSGAGALEIGHLWVIDRTTSDFDVIKLEDVASGWAIAGAARNYAERQLADGLTHWKVLELAGGVPARIDTTMVADAAKAGDQEASFILGKAVLAMAHALNQAVTLLAPHRIILGGGVSLIGEEFWFEPIRNQLNLNVFPPFRGTFDVVPAALGEDVVVQGALALARDAVLNTQRSTDVAETRPS
ncbi:glucokinase [Singulisphaera sp. GP187]|uniref:ROK family protein n=1 Tax=Singulisphaera sp. GP187 TaxID=1882752 RepID=UPI00092B8B59|nr:ROK family protein [Singulisphaera sp. GP187]SIO59918.1 glucokinase [Singulisphaera sp. GP187]